MFLAEGSDYTSVCALKNMYVTCLLQLGMCVRLQQYVCVLGAASWVVECNGCGSAAILGAFSRCVCVCVCHQQSTGGFNYFKGSPDSWH